MPSFETMPTPTNEPKPVIVRKVGPDGKITTEEIKPARRGLESKRTKTKPDLKTVPAEDQPSARDLVRVQSYKDGKMKESVFDRGTKVLESEKRNQWNVMPVAPAPELEPEKPYSQADLAGALEKGVENPFDLLARAKTWGDLISSFKKIDMIADDDGSLYSSEYFTSLAEDLQLATAENYPTADSPLIQSLPEKHGIRAKFVELLKRTPPLTKQDGLFTEKAEAVPQPLKPLPETDREIEPIPVFNLPEVTEDQVEPLPDLENFQSQVREDLPLGFGFEMPEEKLSEDFPNQYKSSAEYQDASDILNKEADQLSRDFESWMATVKKQDPSETIKSPYFGEFAAKRNQARVAARLADRTALYDMLEQEYAELSNSRLENPNASSQQAFDTIARLDEIKRERQTLYEEIARLDNEFMELEVTAQIQHHKKETGFTPEEERALDDVGKFYTKLNETQAQLRQEKSGFLNRVKSFFSTEKKKQIESLEDISRAYQSRLKQAEESAKVARTARSTRLAQRSMRAKGANIQG